VWKQIWEFGRQIFALSSRVLKLEEETGALRQGLKEVRDDIREINRKLDGLVLVLQRLDMQQQHDRENLALRLENALLRFERRLPPGSPPDDEPPS
jgi:septal ring factor EnvC (AmiA/AmiB activator)